jgi:hypothetical protein
MARTLIQISEADATSNFASVLARVRAGAEIVIESCYLAVAVIHLPLRGNLTALPSVSGFYTAGYSSDCWHGTAYGLPGHDGFFSESHAIASRPKEVAPLNSINIRLHEHLETNIGCSSKRQPY